jgi:uncharacterized damage-inducible protein DinB
MSHRNYSLFAAIPALLLCLTQVYGAEPLTDSQRMLYQGTKNNITRAAEAVPEQDYSFKPAPDVRTFGQLVAHVAEFQYVFCGAAGAEKPPSMKIENVKTSKAELVQALKDAFAYCDNVYAGMADANLAKPVSVEGRNMITLQVLTLNTSHNNEHYGNLVTYMRIKGIVPPSSQPRPAPQTK